MSAGWQRNLHRPLTLNDGRRLVTLRDAATFLLEHFESKGLTKYAPLESAIELLQTAERTGERADIIAATEQVARVLAFESLIG